MTRSCWLRPLAAPARRVWGLTWVDWLNFLVLRWFFVRLAYEVPIGRFLTSAPKDGTSLVEIDLMARLPTRWFLNRWIWPVPWAACRYVGCWQGAARGLARQQAPAQHEEQALDFAYGNLAASTSHKPTRSTFAEIAAKRGWSPEQFAAWANARRWWTREGRP